MNPDAPRDPYRSSRIWLIVEAAVEYFITLMISGAYLARLTNTLGFSDSLTGILSSFVSLGCMFQLSGIVLFRRHASIKRPVMLCISVYELLFGCMYLIPLAPLSSGQKMAVFVVGFCVAHLMSNLLRSQRTAWRMSLVDDRARGLYTAVNEMVSLISSMIFTFIMGSIIDAMEARGQSREALILGGVTIFVLTGLHLGCLIFVKEKPVEDMGMNGLSEVRALFSDARFRRVTLVYTLWTVASYAATPYFGPYQIKELGFSMTYVSIISIVASTTRACISPAVGRFGDRHSFARLIYLCFMVAASAFLVNCFTVPANGRVFMMIYTVLQAVASAGIGNSLTNLVLDCVHGSARRSALAITAALSGGAGFAATCLMSPVVSCIQRADNRVLGVPMYPAQFVSLVALLLTVFLIFFVRARLMTQKSQAKCNACDT